MLTQAQRNRAGRQLKFISVERGRKKKKKKKKSCRSGLCGSVKEKIKLGTEHEDLFSRGNDPWPLYVPGAWLLFKHTLQLAGFFLMLPFKRDERMKKHQCSGLEHAPVFSMTKTFAVSILLLRCKLFSWRSWSMSWSSTCCIV